MHCKIEFIKQVFPIFLKPTGEYPYPFEEFIILEVACEARLLDYFDGSV
jgi:hypothetical protein